jgi:hypothetical protein
MKIQKTIGAGVLSLGLLVGLGGYDAGATSRSITHTGPYSYNKIKTEISNRVRVNNDNTLKVENDNWQNAYTGDASVVHNTTGGTAITGNARNANSLDVSATVNNAGAGGAWTDNHAGAGAGAGATIEHTGPHSDNVVKYEQRSSVNIQNDNYIKVDNNNHQQATSGDAKVYGNTTGGDAVSGDATNENSTSVNISVTN